MIRKLLFPVLSIVVILTIVHTIPSSAADTAREQVVSANMDGFASIPTGCCILVSAGVHGTIMVGTDGAWDLSQQSGIVTLDSTSYNLQFTPLVVIPWWLHIMIAQQEPFTLRMVRLH